MVNEGLQMVPRKDRPLPEELEGYVRKTDPEPDYTYVRRELGDWIADYRREEEEKRENQAEGRQPLLGHDPNPELVRGSRSGFSEDDFDIDKVVGVIQKTSRH